MNSKKKGEIWKPISGYEGLYEVSDKARIKSLPRNVHFVDKLGIDRIRTTSEKILSPTLNRKRGRVSVMLSKSSTDHKRISLHRIVAMAFVENPCVEKYFEINHKDENPQNNLPSNLEWCDRKYNMNYNNLPNRRKVYSKSIVGTKGSNVLRFSAIRHAKNFGFDGSGILHSIKTGKDYKGYSWRYGDD